MGEKHSAVGYLFREGAFLPAQETKPVRNEFPVLDGSGKPTAATARQTIGTPFMKEKPDCNSVLSSKRRTWPVSLRSMAVLKKSKS